MSLGSTERASPLKKKELYTVVQEVLNQKRTNQTTPTELICLHSLMLLFALAALFNYS